MEKLKVFVKAWWWVGAVAVLVAAILFTDYSRLSVGVAMLLFAAALVVSPRLFGRCCDLIGRYALAVSDTAETWKERADVNAASGARRRIEKELAFLEELSVRINPVVPQKKKVKRAYTRKPKPVLNAEADPTATHPRTDAEAQARASA